MFYWKGGLKNFGAGLGGHEVVGVIEPEPMADLAEYCSILFNSAAIHQPSNLPKCNTSNANFGEVLKPSENSKKMD